MINYEDIRQYRESGDSAATILTKLQADTRHVRDIKATGATESDVEAGRYDLLHVLRSQLRVLRIGTTAEWKGVLVDYFNQPTPSDPVQAVEFETLKAGFEELLTSLQLTGQTVYCGSDAATGMLVSAMTQLIGVLTGDPTGVKTHIDSLTGGRRYESVTLSDVETAISEFDELEAQKRNQIRFDELYNEFVSPHLPPTDLASLADGLRQLAEEIEVN